MERIEELTVKYHGRSVGTITLSADRKACAFEYDKGWLTDGFSVSPLELPLKSGVFTAKRNPFGGNFGVFEDSLPDGYGRYLLHKTLLRQGINDFNLSALVKQGADKRRITENVEILALFQESGNYQPDAAGVNGTSFADLDRYAIDDYLQKIYATALDGFGGKAEQMLKNIHVLDDKGAPTLAGYLFFGKHPEYHRPTCTVKAVSFFGNELAGTQFRDTKEIVGNMPQIYDKSMAFLKANLHNIQEEGASFNTRGKLEIAEEVLEEVVQNALVHRDLLRSAPIRIFVFDNRVEVISPGALAGGLTEEDIRSGKTYQRNPFMATFATNALHYKGIGSGIVRILAEYPNIQLSNDVNGKEFKVTIPRTVQKEILLDSGIIQKSDFTIQKEEITTQKEVLMDSDTTQKSDFTTQKEEITTQKKLDTTQKKVLEYFKNNPAGTRNEAAEALGDITEDGVKFIIGKLQQKGLLKRVGGRKHGVWQVLMDGHNKM